MSTEYENKNFFKLQGRFVKDAEIVYRQDGKKFLSFSFAHSNPYFKNNEWHQETLFIDCQSFLPTLIQMAHLFKKGVRATIFGQLKMSLYDSQKYGHKIKTFWLFCSGIALEQKQEEQPKPIMPEQGTLTKEDLEQVFNTETAETETFRY